MRKTNQYQFRREPPASGIRQIFDQAKQLEAEGRNVLHLEIGRPDWEMPPGAAAAVTEAINQDFVHYLPNRGYLGLRQAWSNEILDSTGRQFDPNDELIITIGASEAVCIAALALLGPGDEVIVPEPAWPHYRAVAELAGANVVSLDLSPKDGFRLDVDRLRNCISPRTRLLIVNTPGNPTGSVQDSETLRDVAELAIKHGIYVLSDEVYQHFIYDGEHVSIGRFMGDSELFLYVNSVSKSYAMTGWRVGVIGASAVVSDTLNRVHQYLAVCGTAFAQKAAASVLVHPDRLESLRRMHKAFAARMQLWTDGLSGCDSISLVAPAGAFYLFPRIDFNGMSDYEFCGIMLQNHNVAMVPGSVFGPSFKQHVRISCGGALEVQQEALRRLRKVLHAEPLAKAG